MSPDGCAVYRVAEGRRTGDWSALRSGALLQLVRGMRPPDSSQRRQPDDGWSGSHRDLNPGVELEGEKRGDVPEF